MEFLPFLLWLLVAVGGCAAAVVAVLLCFLWSPLVAAALRCCAALGFDVVTLFNIILIIEQYLSTNCSC